MWVRPECHKCAASMRTQLAMLQGAAAISSATSKGPAGFFGGQSQQDDEPGVMDYITNPLTMCKSAMGVEDDGEESDDNPPVPPDQMTSYLLRMCVYSGEEIYGGKTYPEVVIAEGTENEQRHQPSVAAPDTSTPVWEFYFETEVIVDGDAPPCEIKVMSDSLLGSRSLGATALQLPPGATECPKSEVKKLKNVQNRIPGLTQPPESKIRVVWELCLMSAPKHKMPDLIRVAEMNSMASEKKDLTFEIKVGTMRLHKPLLCPKAPEVFLKLELRGRNNRRKVGTQSTNASFFVPEKDKSSKLKNKQPVPQPGASLEIVVDKYFEGHLRSAFGKDFEKDPGIVERYAGYQDQRLIAKNVDLSKGLVEVEGIQDKFPIRIFKTFETFSAPFDTCYWGEKKEEPDWRMPPWSLRSSQVHLLGNDLVIKAFEIKESKEQQLSAIWEEDVGNLLNDIDIHNSRLKFDAELCVKKSGAPWALVRLDLDISWDTPHKSSDRKALETGSHVVKTAAEIKMQKKGGEEKDAVQIKRGLQSLRLASAGEGEKEITYSCTCYVDGLPTYLLNMNPEVRIKMGGNGKWCETKGVSKKQRYYDVDFVSQVKVQCPSFARKAHIQIWNKSDAFMFPQDVLIGETTVYDVTPGSVKWCHCFGGAFGSPAGPDLAMTKGALNPPSTYHGTVAIEFSVKTRQPHGFADERKKEKRKKRLVVRLYKALYLPQSLKGSLVNVLVEVPGCWMPVPDVDPQLDERRSKNRTLLSFPGMVDEHCVLHFNMEGSQGILSVLKSSETKKFAWVQRSTPKSQECFLDVPPGVEHAYLYICEVGREDEPPEYFTRIRLKHLKNKEYQDNLSAMKVSKTVSEPAIQQQPSPRPAKQNQASPRQTSKDQKKESTEDPKVTWIKEVHKEMSRPVWKRLRYDKSVIDPKEDVGDMAGFLLGSACLIDPALDDEDFLRELNPETNDKQKEPENKDLGDIVKIDKYKEDEHLERPFGEKSWLWSEKKSLIPKMTYPTSVMCKPFVGDTYHRSGSTGEPSEILGSLLQKETKTVYAHIDMLAARDLQSKDDDGLCDTKYEIKVNEKVATIPGGLSFENTNNPNFYCRHVIEINVQSQNVTLQGDALMDPDTDIDKELPYVPLPPVIVTLKDKLESDIPLGNLAKKAVAFGVEEQGDYKTLGAIAIKRSELFFEKPGEPVQVGKNHKPVWHGLKLPAHTPWEPAMGGMPPAWQGRPRVLIACAFSMSKTLNFDYENKYEDGSGVGKDFITKFTKEEADTMLTKMVERKPDHINYGWRFVNMPKKICPDPGISEEKYDVTLDLLGLRGLVNDLKGFHSGGRILYIKGIQSKSKKHIQINVDNSDMVNPNFVAKVPQENWEQVAENVKELLRIQSEKERAEQDNKSSGDESRRLSQGSQQPDNDDSEAESVATSVDVEDFLGCRIKEPGVEVPVIPYLQDFSVQFKTEAWGENVEAMLCFLTGDRQTYNGKTCKLLSRTAGGWKVRTLESGNELSVEERNLAQDFDKLPPHSGMVHSSEEPSQAQGKKCFWLKYHLDWEQELKVKCRDKMGIKTTTELRRYLRITDNKAAIIRQFNPAFAEEVPENRFPLFVQTVIPEPLVLMPDLVFELRSATMKRILSSCTIQIPRPTKDESLVESWFMRSVKERNEQPEQWKNFKLAPFKHIQPQEDAYDVFVDVFAAKKGYLTWDDDVKMGRCIRQQKLFEISPNKKMYDDDSDSDEDDEKAQKPLEEDGTAEPFKQYFNPMDWMLGVPRFLDEPYDTRVAPWLRCADWDGEKCVWKSTRQENVLPLTKSNQYKGLLSCCQSYTGTMNNKPTKKTTKKPKKSTEKNSETSSNPLKTTTDLIRKSTKDLKVACAEHHYRCMSHLHVPEYVSKFQNPEETEKYNNKEELKKNLRCFMRKVGHEIKLEDRDSKYLCKLRISPPEGWLGPDESEKKTEAKGMSTSKQSAPELSRREAIKKNKPMELDALENCRNFLYIKFKKPGTIIWAPPMWIFEWNSPGKVLFVVKTHEGSLVPVVVPNFDLRFPRETAYYPLKNLNSRWRTLEITILKNEKERRRRLEKSKAAKKDMMAVRQSKEKEKAVAAFTAKKESRDADVIGETGDSKDDDDEDDKEKGEEDEKEERESDGEPDEVDPREQPPDGSSQPVWVHQNAFVVRLFKRKDGLCYDRVQTENWYRVVLEQIFPEVRDLRKDDVHDLEHTKNMFFSRFMNIRQTLTLNDPEKPEGMLKGHIRVSKHDPNMHAPVAELRSRGSLFGLAPFGGNNDDDPVTHRPIEDFWIASEVQCHVYVLTANEMKMPSLAIQEVLGSVHLSVTAEIVGLHHHPVERKLPGTMSLQNIKSQGTVPFYQHFPLSTSIPGPNLLRLSIWAKPVVDVGDLPGMGNLPGIGNLNQGTLIGTAEIDLEDRWLTFQRRMHRSACNRDYVEANMCPAEKVNNVTEAYRFKVDNKKEETKEQKDLEKSKSGRLRLASNAEGDGGVFDGDRKKKLYWDPQEVREMPNTKKPYRAGGLAEYNEMKKKGGGVGLETPETLATPAGQVEQSKSGKGTTPAKPGQIDSSRDIGAHTGSGQYIVPRICPPDPLPIEIVELQREDEDTAAATKVGVLRLWVDMSEGGDEYNAPKLNIKPVEFEVRVLIKGIREISVFKDAGERNDVFVTLDLTVGDYTGKKKTHKVQTETHDWANDEANYNQRFLFQVTAPCTICSLRLTLKDADMITDDDPIYDPKDVPLDHLLMLAHRNNRELKPPLGVHSMTVKFDSWPKRDKPNRCCRCPCIRRTEEKPCYLKMDVQIVPKEEAEAHPVKDGVISPPAGRFDYITALQHPIKFIRILVGPQCCALLKWCAGITGCVLVLLLLLMGTFFFMNSFVKHVT